MVYEIWSLGHKPFENITAQEVCVVFFVVNPTTLFDNYFVCKILERLETGYRLPPPPGCPRSVYRIMMKCW